MARPSRFLRAMAHALELRQRGMAHSGVRRAGDSACFAALSELLSGGSPSVFHFSSAGVEYGRTPLAEFDGWAWAARLAARGIERLELAGNPDPAELAAFLDFAAGLAPDEKVPLGLVRQRLRWGPAPADHGQEEREAYPLTDELDVMRQVFDAAGRGDRLSLGDVHAVVASLTVLVAEAERPGVPLRHGVAREDYQPAHALNSALLALVVADALGLKPEERQECALAALLHDIGMARLPPPTMTGDHFTSQDRALVRGHPMEGARFLLRHGDLLEGSAVVSYEHHLRQDGSGYPRLSYPREPHVLSKVVAVCDAFDALLAPRPDRSAFEPSSALIELERSTASHFDPRVVAAFSGVMHRTSGGRAPVLTMRRK